MTPSAMFPLGMVLFPAQILPLRIFEPRYRSLVNDCMRDQSGFGVVLIERGSEVGGGDQRVDLGTMAHIVRAQPHPDGRWSILAVGTERIRVDRWLDDDPYPRADIEPFPDAPIVGSIDASLAEATGLLREVLARLAELGEPVPAATFDLSDSPLAASYQLASHAPVGPLDRLGLLHAPGPNDRLDQLIALLADQRELCQARLAIESDDS